MFQYNDPDSLLWITVYLAVASLAIISLRGKMKAVYPLVLSLLILVLIALNFDKLLAWIQEGYPGVMSESQTGEGIREFLGLCVSIVVALFYLTIKKYP